MKVSTTVTYTQRVLAPKGFVFSLEKVNKSGLFYLEEMPADQHPVLGLGGRILEWKEPWNISGEINDSEFWEIHLTPCLVEVQD